MERIETIRLDYGSPHAREIAAERVRDIEREHRYAPVGPWFQGRDERSKRMVILTSNAESAAQKILDEGYKIKAVDVFAMRRISC